MNSNGKQVILNIKSVEIYAKSAQYFDRFLKYANRHLFLYMIYLFWHKYRGEFNDDIYENGGFC